MTEIPQIEWPLVDERTERLRLLRSLHAEITHSRVGSWDQIAQFLNLSSVQIKKLFAARGRGQGRKIAIWERRLPQLHTAATGRCVTDEMWSEIATVINALIDNEQKTDSRQRVFNASAHRPRTLHTTWRHLLYLALKHSGAPAAQAVAAGYSDAKNTVEKTRAKIRQRPSKFVGTGNLRTGEFTEKFTPAIEREFQVMLRWARNLGARDDRQAAEWVAAWMNGMLKKRK